MLLFKQVFAKYAYLRKVNTNAGFVLHQCEECRDVSLMCQCERQRGNLTIQVAQAKFVTRPMRLPRCRSQ
jgi:hypothetical protein